MKKYGKKCSDIIGIKNNFFVENDAKLKEAKRHAAVYNNQPERICCKICGDTVKDPDFLSLV